MGEDDREWMEKAVQSSCYPDLLGIWIKCISFQENAILTYSFVHQPSRKFDKGSWGIHLFMHSLDIYWVSTMSWAREIGYEGESFFLNVRERLSCSALLNPECVCLPYPYQLPLLCPPPIRYLKGGNKWRTTGRYPMCDLHESGNPFIQHHRAGKPEEGI